MNKDAESRWKVGMSNTKLKMRVKSKCVMETPVGAVWSEPVSGPISLFNREKNRELRGFGLE